LVEAAGTVLVAMAGVYSQPGTSATDMIVIVAGQSAGFASLATSTFGMHVSSPTLVARN
jgi:hypothetical protein